MSRINIKEVNSNFEDNPLISIITVVYNGEEFLEDTIQSVINQDYDNVEYIIIDGGSTDGTLNIIKKYEAQIDYWVSEPDKGIYDAMNKGIEKATGAWINFMNTGDSFYNENVLSYVSRELKIDTEVLYGTTAHSIKGIVKPQPLFYFYFTIPFCHQAIFVKTEKLKRENFSLKFKYSSDYYSLLRLYVNGGKFHKIDKVIAKYDDVGASTKFRLIVRAEREKIIREVAPWALALTYLNLIRLKLLRK